MRGAAAACSRLGLLLLAGHAAGQGPCRPSAARLPSSRAAAATGVPLPTLTEITSVSAVQTAASLQTAPRARHAGVWSARAPPASIS